MKMSILQQEIMDFCLDNPGMSDEQLELNISKLITKHRYGKPDHDASDVYKATGVEEMDMDKMREAFGSVFKLKRSEVIEIIEENYPGRQGLLYMQSITDARHAVMEHKQSLIFQQLMSSLDLFGPNIKED